MNIISNFPEKDKEIRSGFKYYFPLIAFMTACFLAMLALVWRVCQMPIEYEELIGEPIPEVKEVEVKEAPVEETEVQIHMTDDDILAAVAMHEAGNQDVLGKAFVIMTVLNRCDYYDATVEQIVTAPNQYAYPYYGVITHDTYVALELAREYRHIFKPIAWFQTDSYPAYGEPAFQWGDHYFCYIPDWEERED